MFDMIELILSNIIISMSKYKVKYFTGLRPSSNLTVANYLGSVNNMLAIQNDGKNPFVFVADLHALTDKEPKLVKKFIPEIVADYIGLGLDPKKSTIFVQSDIAGEVTYLMALLSRLITSAELLRIPTIKEKLKANQKPENANALLMMYPVLMAADILLQRSEYVPVGQDQLAHLEVTRLLARRFNDKYGDVLPPPKVYEVKSLRILSLKGDGKMSKSSPEGAIFLTDDKATVTKKIKRAETAFEGEMSDKLESHILVAKSLTENEEDKEEIDDIIVRHMKKERVMGEFKNKFTEIVIEFLEKFQVRRESAVKDPDYIKNVLADGAKLAKANANETLNLINEKMMA